ncbi:hypothetical protein KSP39_PZI017128 [Platanthera zijinensis]|uniref:Pyrroline-5-carboxylate reductase n=1 Tax=Platanthera zijinensis TaxID=2320716 RepID=A0AAP0B5B0_9ASPA
MADPERVNWSSLMMKAMTKRRIWASLFLLVYALLLFSSWSLILSIRSWYAAASSSPSPASLAWTALYASVLYGGIFGLLSVGAALAVAVPATVVTWITILVLLAFAGKSRRTLVMEGRRITADIAGFAVKILLREGNIVAALCAFVSFVFLILRRRGARRGNQDENL